MSRIRTRHAVFTLGLAAATVTLVLLPQQRAESLHTPGAPVFEPAIGYKLCNDLSPGFGGPAPLQGGGGACAENTDQGGNPDLTFSITIPAGNLNISPDVFVLTLSGEFDIAAGAAIPNGSAVAGVTASVRLGLISGGCSTVANASFILYDSSADPGNLLVMDPTTITVFDGNDPYDGKADPFSPMIARYPDFNNRFFDPDGSGDFSAGYSPVQPHARYAGATEIFGHWQLLQVFVFQPGALKAAFDADPANATHPFARLHPELGWTMVVLLNGPSGFDTSPSTIMDFCSPVSATGAMLGRVDTIGDGVADTDRLTSPAAVGGIDGEGTQLAQFYALSLRDLDEDGIDNSLDTCPDDPGNVEDPWITNGPDADGIDSACDPNPSVTSPGAPPPNGNDDDGDTLVDEDPVNAYDDDGDGLTDEDGECESTALAPDEDQDCYPDRQDNCPLAANIGQTESELTTPRNTASPDGGPWNDRIGDACDPNPAVGDGLFFHAFESDAFCISDDPLADEDGDGWCSVSAGADPDDGDPEVTGARNQDADGFLFPGQPGHDFRNHVEIWIQTEPLADCPEVVGEHDAWPPDFNASRSVNSVDTLFFSGHIGANLGDPNYDRRLDLDASGKITIVDVLLLSPVVGTSCTPP